MRLTGLRWLAVSSALLCVAANAETRPRYGGVLRVETMGRIESLAPGGEDLLAEQVSALLYDTLTGREERAGLAERAVSSRGGDRWEFTLRPRAVFADGSPVTAAAVAASVNAANPALRASGEGDRVVVAGARAVPHLAEELAKPKYAIVKRTAAGELVGSGPFRVKQFVAGRRLALVANEEYWGGRPYLDAIEIQTGRAAREQMVALQLGQADVIELPVESRRRAAQEGVRVSASQPVELIAVVGAGEWREALAQAVDRGAMHRVLLQQQGEPTSALLPNWMTGYAFLFDGKQDGARARAARPRALTLGYDPSDGLGRALAERIALDARAAGLQVRPVAGGTGDARVARIALRSPDASAALGEIAAALGAPPPEHVYSAETAYAAERRLRDALGIVPVVHVPVAYGVAARVKDWTLSPAGDWRLADVWVEGKP